MTHGSRRPQHAACDNFTQQGNRASSKMTCYVLQREQIFVTGAHHIPASISVTETGAGPKREKEKVRGRRSHSGLHYHPVSGRPIN